MKGLIEKSLKRYLKRRKRITFGFIISFLITGGVSYSEAIEIKYENGKVTATSGTVVKEENGNFIWSSTEDIEGIKIDKSVIDSNIIVSINNNNKIENTVGEGISTIYHTSIIGDIINGITGQIIGKNYGIYQNAGKVTIGNIENHGLIKGKENSGVYIGPASYGINKIINYGKVYGKSYGFSIDNSSGGKIESLYNAGEIVGEGGSGISSFGILDTVNSETGKIYGKTNGMKLTLLSDINKIENAGEIVASSLDTTITYSDAKGLELNYMRVYNTKTNINLIKNTNKISGKKVGNNNGGYGIYFNTGIITVGSTDSNIENGIINSGTILGEGDYNGGGILAKYLTTFSLSTLNNSGIISGKGTSNEGYGVYVKKGKINEIINSGTISGEGGVKGQGLVNTGDDSGFEITIGKIDNTGKILGKSSNGEAEGIYISGSGGTMIVGDITNSGIISGEGITNGYGIYIYGGTKTIGDIANKGFIYGKGNNTQAASLYLDTGNLKMGNLNNEGIMFGEGSGNTYGILITGGTSQLEDTIISSNGSIFGNGKNEAAGIKLSTTKMGNLNNEGIIYGKASNGKGYGLYTTDGNSKLGVIDNIGTILGEGVQEGNGISITDYSEYNTINNNGVISGKASGGNGYAINKGSLTSNVKNNGLIAGIGTNDGIAFNTVKTSQEGIDINNSGAILGIGEKKSGTSSIFSSSNYGTIAINNLLNSGTIYSSNNNSFSFNNTTAMTMKNVENSGIISSIGNIVGIVFNNNGIEKILNSGVISGVGNNGYAFYGLRTSTTDLKNNGIIAGKTDIFLGQKPSNIVNNGLIVTGFDGEENSNLKIEGSFEPINLESENKLVINGIDKENKARAILSSEINEKENLIINVVGNDENSVIVDNGEILLLSNSTINSIGTAVQVKDGTFTANNLVINSGSYEKAIVGTDINLKNGTVVNGGISSIRNLTIDDSVKLNGKLDGNSSANLLFESSVTQDTRAISGNNINIYQDISNFKSTTIGTNVTLYETVDAQLGDIVIKKGANLVLRVKPTGTTGGVTRATDSTLQVYSTHALMNNSGTISSEGGKLLFDLNGLGIGTVLDFGSNNKLDETMKGKETQYEDDVTIDTTSSLFTIQLGADGKPVVHPVKDLPLKPPVIDSNTPEEDPIETPPGSTPGEDITFPEEGKNPVIDGIEYSKLNSIYQSMTSTDETKYFDVSDDKKLEGFIKYLADVYRANPYSYSSELSRKSMDMLKNSVLGRELRPDIHKWAVYGGLTHVDGGTKDKYYGRNYYSFDAGKSSVESDMKLTGAYAQAEYGLSLDNTVGIVLGGTNSEAKISSSKLDGDSIYLGVYGKRYIDNMRIALGVGYQYGDYEGNRLTKDYSNIFYDKTNAQSYSGNYNDNGINIYTDIRYTHKIKDNLYFEPYFNVGYTFIKQDKIREEGVLSLDTKEKEFNYLTAKVGGDLKREVLGSKGKHILKAGVDYENIVSGSEATELKSSYKGGKKFGVLVAEKNNDIITTHIKYEYEHQNGTLMDIVSSYSFARENMKNEWKIGAGIGYKF